jgi:hypothetical protein
VCPGTGWTTTKRVSSGIEHGENALNEFAKPKNGVFPQPLELVPFPVLLKVEFSAAL